ncbi:MAG: HEAT repeat domain-containing protein [Candidatus Hermodarchaeota archaeon]
MKKITRILPYFHPRKAIQQKKTKRPRSKTNNLLKRITSPDKRARKKTIELLTSRKDRQTVDMLIDALFDKNIEVRRAAAEVLGKIKDPRAINALMEILYDNNWRVKSAAARALVAINPRSVEELIESTTSNYPVPWIWAIEALITLEDLRVVDALIIKLPHMGTETAIRAIEMLSKFRDPCVVAALIYASKSKNQVIAQTAIQKLIRMNSQSNRSLNENNFSSQQIDIRILIESPCMKSLIQGLKDKNWHVRKAAIETLSKIGLPSVEGIIEILKERRSRNAFETLVALDSVLGSLCVTKLIQTLHDEDWKVRQLVVEALGYIRNPRAIDALVPVLEDNHNEVRKATVKTLALFREERVLQPLIYTLNDEDYTVFKTVMGALPLFPQENIIIPLFVKFLAQKGRLLDHIRLKLCLQYLAKFSPSSKDLHPLRLLLISTLLTGSSEVELIRYARELLKKVVL